MSDKKTSRMIAAASLLFALLLSLAVFSVLPAKAFGASAFDQSASESYSYSDTHTGNMFLLDHSVSSTSISNDLYWAGQSFDAENLRWARLAAEARF